MVELPQILDRCQWVEDRIHRGLEEKRARREAKPGKLAISQIGDCARNLWADVNGVPEDEPLSGKVLAIFNFGNVVEGEVDNLLLDANFRLRFWDDDTDEQIRVTDFDERLSGRLDGEIELGRGATKHWAVLEIKSAKTEQWQECCNVGYAAWQPKYAAQIQMYTGYRKRDEALVIVYAKETSRIYAERIRHDPAQFHALRCKAGKILASPSVLDRPPEAKSQYCAYCKWCSRNAWCWGPLAETRFDP